MAPHSQCKCQQQLLHQHQHLTHSAAPTKTRGPRGTAAAAAAASASEQRAAAERMPPPREDPSSSQSDREAEEEQEEEVKPWRRLFHAEQLAAEQQQQQQEQQQREQQQQGAADAAAAVVPPSGGDEQPQQQLTELQQQMLAAYRRTCLVAGAGLVGSIWQWRATMRGRRREVFLPPRAQALPPEVVRAWKEKAELREALRTVGRQTLFVAGVAGLYFGTELAVGVWRGAPGGDWRDTACAGAVAGGFLGARAPSSLRGRTLALGAAAGGALGALSGWAQQQLLRLAEEQEEGRKPGGGGGGGRG